jgi:hypothetical protein
VVHFVTLPLPPGDVHGVLKFEGGMMASNRAERRSGGGIRAFNVEATAGALLSLNSAGQVGGGVGWAVGWAAQLDK